MKHLLNWQVGFCDSVNSRPSEYVPAVVPGAVQLDYKAAKNMPDYNRGTNSKEYAWMEDKFWVYTAEFDATNIADDSNLILFAKGIDYQYDIYVNGEKIYSHTGMYKYVNENLTRFKGGKIKLEIVIYPIPISTIPIFGNEVHKGTRDEANQCCKPAVSYGWDFHPRLVPLGIWEDISIVETKRAALVFPKAKYKLSEDRKTAKVTLYSNDAPDAKWEFFDPDGNVIFTGDGETVEFEISDVQLWWCNGYGEQKLYSWKFSAENMPEKCGKLGMRTVELVKCDDSWEELHSYPMSRNSAPITLRLNGVDVFAKGSNWVAPEIFYGKLDYNRYYEQLILVRNANLNFVRCWGGAIINKDSFFEICDELGIFVWQEFPLACNKYVGTDYYMAQLKSEATALVQRLKSHACIMAWCGGNELFNNWSKMTDQDEAIRFLNHLTYSECPEIPFVSTAPVEGMAHGPYTFNLKDGKDSEIIKVMAESNNTAYTEFGVEGASNMENMAMIGEESELFPVPEISSGFYGGRHTINMRCMEEYFGETKSLKQLVDQQQFMQSFGLQCIFEEARRQKPYCSMVSNWCFNEPWPTFYNGSLVCYPNDVKPAYYSVAEACRSVLASARIRKFSYVAGDMLDFDLYLLNDSLSKVKDGSVNVYVEIGNDYKEFLLKWDYANVTINENVAGPTVRYMLPAIDGADHIKVILECGDYSSSYVMLYRLPEKPANAPAELNALAKKKK